jgi:hypothetical protein
LETLAGLLLAFFWRMKMLAEFPLAFLMLENASQEPS